MARRSSPSPPPAPRTLGGYRLVRELGRGASAVVWEAEGPTGPVAVKVLTKRGARDEERLFREARAAARVDHPAVVRVLGEGETDDGEAFLVLELCDGGSLAARSMPLPPAEVRSVVVRLAEALAAAHEAGVVHRDVKPANVLFRGGLAALADFGLARAEGEPALTVTGELLGTPLYMAPEAALGTRTAAGDVYALGCLWLELVTGSPPFVGPARKVLVAHATTAPTLPDGCDPLLVRALSKSPADRPTARDVALGAR